MTLVHVAPLSHVQGPSLQQLEIGRPGITKTSIAVVGTFNSLIVSSASPALSM